MRASIHKINASGRSLGLQTWRSSGPSGARGISALFPTSPRGPARSWKGDAIVTSLYIYREFIFTAYKDYPHDETVVFWVDDFTDDECQILEDSVQRCIDKNNKGVNFGMATESHDDSVVFVTMKAEWARIQREIWQSGNRAHEVFDSDIAWVYEIAIEHAEVIRKLRKSKCPTVYFQIECNEESFTFAFVDNLTCDEIETLESVLTDELYRVGIGTLQTITNWHAEREPAAYVKAKLRLKAFQEDDEEDNLDDEQWMTRFIFNDCLKEILALRKMPMIYGPAEDDEDVEENGFQAESDEINTSCLEASEEFRSNFRDPDNYWRNVWLYKQREAGLTNTAILEQLSRRSQEFAPIESDNALRNAISAIAQHHKWPEIKGKPGRPKVNINRPETPQ